MPDLPLADTAKCVISVCKLFSKAWNIQFQPSELIVPPNSVKNINLTLSEAPKGLSGYNITISLSNGNVAEIVSVEFPKWAVLNENSSIPADSVWIKAVDLKDQVKSGFKDIILATIAIKGEKQGETEIVAHVEKIDDDYGDPIVPSVKNGRFKVLPTQAFTPTPKPIPGFETIFAIAGLAAIAYLLRRKS